MATNRDFQAMLNEYLALDLMKEELRKRDYLMQKVNMDEGWKGGTIPVPFRGQSASTYQFGSLAASNNVSKYKYIRGQLTTQREAWGTLRFEHRDIMEHDGKVNEKSFLKILPGQIEDFITDFKMYTSINMLNGPHIAKATVDGTASGVLEVDRIDRFQLDQELVLDDNNSAPVTVYVIGIDVNGGTLKKGALTLSASRGGAALDISAYTVAQDAKLYHVGAQTESFTSIKSQLLSAANGGSTTLFGQTKTAYPFLQAVNIDGSTVTSSNILQKIFDGYSQRQILAKSPAIPEVIMSFKHMGSVLKLLETQKGPFNVVAGSRKVSSYGWQEVSVGSVSGEVLKLVAIQEMDDDWIWYADWDSVTLYSNGLIQRRKAPDGKEYFEVRETSGYAYVLDHCLFGDIAVTGPCKQAIMYGIPNY